MFDTCPQQREKQNARKGTKLHEKERERKKLEKEVRKTEKERMKKEKQATKNNTKKNTKKKTEESSDSEEADLEDAADDSSDAAEEGVDGQYSVVAALATHLWKTNGRRYYLVRWSGKDPDTGEEYEDSWEPATPCLTGCPGVITAFKNDNPDWKDQYSKECEELLNADRESEAA